MTWNSRKYRLIWNNGINKISYTFIYNNIDIIITINAYFIIIIFCSEISINKNALTNVHYIEWKTKEANISLSKLNLTLPIQKLNNSPKQNLSIVSTVNNWPKIKKYF